MATKVLMAFMLWCNFSLDRGALLNHPALNGLDQTKFGNALGVSSGIGASPFSKSSTLGHLSIGYGINDKHFQQSSLHTEHISPPKAIQKGNGGHEHEDALFQYLTDDKVWHLPPYQPGQSSFNLKAEVTADLIYQDHLYHNIMANIKKSYRQPHLLDEIFKGKLSKAKGIHNKIPSRYFFMVALADSLLEYLFHEGNINGFLPEKFTDNTDFLAAFNEAKAKFIAEWLEDDRRLKIFMVVKGLIPEEMDNFVQTFEKMYPPFTQTELDIAAKMENAFEEYKKKNHNIFDCVVRPVISFIVLLFEKSTRNGMEDDE